MILIHCIIGALIFTPIMQTMLIDNFKIPFYLGTINQVNLTLNANGIYNIQKNQEN